MKYLLTLFLVFVSSFSLLAKDNKDYDFRKTKWGMSLEEVKKVETAKIDTVMDSCLAYYTEVMGIKVHLFYEFKQNKLYKAKYVVTQHHNFVEDFLEDYYSFKWILTKKYGAPFRDGEAWANKQYEESSFAKPYALRLGHLSFITLWVTERSTIGCSIDGDKYDEHGIFCSVCYMKKDDDFVNSMKLNEKDLTEIKGYLKDF